MKVISIIGYKDTGKTTLVINLIKELSKIGSVGIIKNMVHQSFNQESTDTSKCFNAGAKISIGVTKNEYIMIEDNPSIEKALDSLNGNDIDFAIIEGYKKGNYSKIVIGEVEEELSNVIAKVPKVSNCDIKKLVEIIIKLPDIVTLESLINKIKKNIEIKKAGAIGTFTGIVRGQTGGVETTELEFEEYEQFAKKIMDKISNELKEKEGIIDVLIHHNIGVIKPSEDIVYIVVAASHREQLFSALRDAIERLKLEVPIWKKEFTENGEYWVKGIKES